ncbi:MAG TPA: choice-of-anchor Q domain-containing protein [Blastocatellia bacterium]|nr:choice-of-anchor Q domain-containing protein [Blastocatellia bacterium]
MKTRIVWVLLTLIVSAGALLGHMLSPSSRASSTSLSPNMSPPLALNVNSTADILNPPAGTVTLRSAIVAANADLSATPAIINLTVPGTYNLTLTNATQENAAASGDLDITTTLHTVTIIGGGTTGPNATIIDAAGLNIGSSHDRAFQIASGASAIFQDLVIRHGQAADDGSNGASTDPTSQNTNRAGGGILNTGGTVTLMNVIIDSCQALGKGDNSINDHLDALGGGLASLMSGTVTVSDSTFTGNTAVGAAGNNINNGGGSNSKGGSIYFEGGTLNINGARIDNSAANGGNGGNVDQNGMLNGGAGGIAQGGGVWVGGGTVTINNTTFENTTTHGGNSGTGGNGSEPAGEADGGGLYSLGNTTLTNSTFHLAGATGGNGGNAFGTSCVGAHLAGDGGAARGGAVLADGGTMIINTATFANNFAIGGNGGNGGQTDGGLGCGMHGAGGLAHGGAITNNNAATLNIKHGTISANNAQAGNTGVNQGGASKPARLVAEGAGGGIRVGPAAVTLENTIIAGNTAANGLGDTTGAPTPGPNVDGAITSNGHNLLGVATDATGFTGPGDQTGANPMLMALADNGGPTQTMALTTGSPAIDAGVAAGAMFDQRGRFRTFDDPAVNNAATSDGTDIGAFELQPLCSLTCPTDVTTSNDQNQCSAVVNYTTPSGAGCGTVTCNPASGSFFPVGATTVTCTSPVGPTCSFKVTVNDTQSPVITCPASLNAKTPSSSSMCTVVNFSVTAQDNCPGVTVACAPPSGTCFVVGTTTVSCTATDASANTASCSFTVSVFNVALQDDSNPALGFLGNSSTGAYRFCTGSMTFTGVATVTKKGNVITFQQTQPDRRVAVFDDEGTFRGTAVLQIPLGTIKIAITDRDTRNSVPCP